MKLFWTVSLLSFLVALATANDNVHSWLDHEFEMSVGMTSHEKDAKVSGTNVNCVFNARVAPMPSEPPSSVKWERATLISLKVVCEDLNVTFTPAPLNAGNLSKTIRIATTHFDDNATIEFTVTGKFKLEDDDNGMGTITVEKVWAASLRSYNRAHLLATRKDYDPYQLDLGPYGYSWNSIQGVTDGRPKIVSLKHSVVPASGSEKNQEEPAVGLGLLGSTFVFWFTHGWASGMEASYSSHADSNGVLLPGTPTNDDGNLLWPEIYDYCFMGRTVPPINLVLAYSCSTTSVYPQCSDAFGITITIFGYTIPLNDRAYAGFARTVWSMGHRVDVPAGYWPLYEHSNRVLLFLSQGNTIDEAVTEANDRVRVCDDVGQRLDMEVKGDQFARIIYVYMSGT
ncbi:MAG TPA: hypothetical protein VJ835_11655 [Fimbriimonadaceae bacterium]|nr:hypothetical protein [Fimbriimonadaceae bacterium]